MEETPLWLSHHRPAHYHRCIRVGGARVCARCLGLYPILFALLALQMAMRLSHPLPLEGWWVMLLPVPALLDWARGRLAPSSGSNLSRLVTGALLGVALARSLFLHFLRPFNVLSSAQLSFLALVFGLVEGVAWLKRRRGTDPFEGPHV